MSLPSIAIVIVNWNSGNQLAECIRSIPAAALALRSQVCLKSIIVVDNGSRDGSDQHLSCEGIHLHVIRNGLNRGFAAACNQGAVAALPCDQILFLNPDTLLFANSLSIASGALLKREYSNVGIVGISLVDSDGVVSRSCARFPRAKHFLAQALAVDRLFPHLGHTMREWDHKSTREVDQVIGAFFLVRAKVFEQLNGFDERFFVYFEEVDFALRAKSLGWGSLFVADTSAFHRGGGTSEQVRALRLFYSLRSRTKFFRKHSGLKEIALVYIVTWLLEPISRFILLLCSARFTEIQHLVAAYRLLIRDTAK